MKIGIEDIYDVLRTIDDPEMPISIVDLGLVEDVRIEAAPNAFDGAVRAVIDLVPTFVGCFALSFIEAEVRRHVRAMDGVADVAVAFLNDPPWSVDRITDAGRESLRGHGITVPQRGGLCGAGESAERAVPLTISAAAAPTPCPFCGSDSTRLESPFGPTRCKMIYYCDACRNSFEHLKRV